jgi:hypothetical protein
VRRWPSLIRSADDRRYPIDNNPAKGAIRPIALGRKNWLFAGSESAGKCVAATQRDSCTRDAVSHQLAATQRAGASEPSKDGSRKPTELFHNFGTYKNVQKFCNKAR